MDSPATFRLRLLGSPLILGPDGTQLSGSVTQRHRVALLALLALAPGAGLGRDRLLGYLWPESDTAHARRLLNQAVYVLRQTLGEAAILATGTDLRLNHELLQVDVSDFESALARGDPAGAVELYGGPFLDGFFLGDSLEFERWTDGERERLADRYARALEALAESAEGSRDFSTAAEWWKRRAALDRYDSRVALRLVQALATSGNLAGALQRASTHELLLREEFGAEAPREFKLLVERLRSAAPPSDGMVASEEPALAPAAVDEAVDTAQSGAGNEVVLAAVGAPALDGTSTRGRWLLAGLGSGLAALALTAAIFAVLRLDPGRAASLSSTDPDQPLPRPPTWNPAANEFYERARDPALLRSDSGALLRLDFCRRAVELDPSFAEARACLATGYLRALANSNVRLDLSPSEHIALADNEARTALALDDSLAFAHRVSGWVRYVSFDYPGAEAHYQHARALEPAETATHDALVDIYLLTGRPQEALSEARTMEALSPIMPSGIAQLARALIANGRYAEALVQVEKLKSLDPPLLRTALIVAELHGLQGRWAAAIEAILPQGATEGHARALYGFLLARSGNREEAARVRADLLERAQTRGYGAAHVAVVDAGLGDFDSAFVWLDRAIDDGSIIPPWGYGGVFEPIFQDLHQDPRFALFRQKLGLPSQTGLSRGGNPPG